MKLQANSGRPIAVKKAVARDKLASVVPQGQDTYLVKLAQTPAHGSVSDSVQIEYEVDGARGQLAVPVLGIIR